ncbi:MAG TPA: hypothetical protein VHD36_21640 [Pirellulales bacterium]|nr:hypothetical protein [Pirellulales bacterium]
MRNSFAKRFAAALILSALVPLVAMAQDATTPTTKTPTATPKATAPQRNMRKITSRYLMGNRPMATRGTSWRNRQFHRAGYGRTHTGNHRTWSGNGQMPAGTAAAVTNAPAKGTAAATTNAGTAAKKAGGAHHKHPTGKHKATPTSNRHVARSSHSATRHMKLANFSHRR